MTLILQFPYAFSLAPRGPGVQPPPIHYQDGARFDLVTVRADGAYILRDSKGRTIVHNGRIETIFASKADK